MKLLFDVFPVLLFFLVFWWGKDHAATAHDLVNQYLGAFMSGGAVVGDHAPLLLATAVAIVATVAQVGFELIRRKPVSITLWTTLIVIVVLGGLTIYFNDDRFIKFKPTAVYWLIAATLAGSRLLFKKNAIRSIAKGEINLPDHVWNKIDSSWAIFFVCLGILNLFVAFVLFKDNLGAWVNFKLACIGITVVFAIVQAMYISKYLEDPK